MTSSLTITPYQKNDLQAVIKLWTDCGLTRPWNDPEQDINFATTNPNSTILIGRGEGELIASAMVGHDGHRGVIYYLAVAPDHQKKGYGRDMVIAAENWLKEQGVWKINLLVRQENKRVTSFYETLGYAQNPAISFGKRLD